MNSTFEKEAFTCTDSRGEPAEGFIHSSVALLYFLALMMMPNI